MALKKIPADYPMEKAPDFDPQIVDLWEADLLRGCQDAMPWQTAYDAAVRRQKALKQLDAAIRVADNGQIVDAAAALAGYPLPGNWAGIVRQARADADAVRGLLEVLRSGRRERLAEVFDVRVIRQNAKAMAPYKAPLRQWLTTEILPAAKLGLDIPVGQKPLAKDPTDRAKYQACWKWPASRFNEQCMLVLCRSKPRPQDDPRKMVVQHHQMVDRKKYEEAGGMVPLNVIPEWQRCYVVVWALVDLGFEDFFSEPVVLGRMEATK